MNEFGPEISLFRYDQVQYWYTYFKKSKEVILKYMYIENETKTEF